MRYSVTSVPERIIIQHIVLRAMRCNNGAFNYLRFLSWCSMKNERARGRAIAQLRRYCEVRPRGQCRRGNVVIVDVAHLTGEYRGEKYNRIWLIPFRRREKIKNKLTKYTPDHPRRIFFVFKRLKLLSISPEIRSSRAQFFSVDGLLLWWRVITLRVCAASIGVFHHVSPLYTFHFILEIVEKCLQKIVDS